MQLFFLIEPGPYFILNPETLSFGGGEPGALHEEELFFGDVFFLRDIEDGIHDMLHFSKR